MGTRRLAFFLYVVVVAIVASGPDIVGQNRGALRSGRSPVEGGVRSNDTTILINAAMPPPAWALAERTLLDLNAQGAALFADKYLDANHYLRGPEHWGISDGPDDSMEGIRNWPLAHALGGPDSLIDLWDKTWEGPSRGVQQGHGASHRISPRMGSTSRNSRRRSTGSTSARGSTGFYFYRPEPPNR